ncbi:MAG: hypothetical protein V4603_09370, partial [Pseudomonadota bacterium]
MKLTKLFRATALSTLMLAATAALAIEAPTDAGVDWRGPDGSTALQWAVYDGDADKVKALIADG